MKKENPFFTYLFVFSIIAFLVTLYLNFELEYNYITNNQELVDGRVKETNKRTLYLYELKGEIGYLGIIHHFKNFVLRKDLKYFERFQLRLQEFKESLKSYLKIKDITKLESLKLKIIEQTINEYGDKIHMIKKNLDLNPLELDKFVKVDDTPAHMAINWLNEYLNKRKAEEVKLLQQASNNFVFRAKVLRGITFFFFILAKAV